MIKRVFEIIIFPFYLIFQFISFPFKILKIILDDKTEERKHNKKITLRKTSQEELIEIGQYLFADFYTDFATFFNSFLNDKKTFLVENKELLEEYVLPESKYADNFELDKLKAIEVVYIFGDSKQKLNLIDWRGEENEREIEIFLEDKLRIKTDWKNVNELREGVIEEKQRDGKFIIDLFITIDKDLEPLNKRMIFFELGWDSYVFTVVDQTSYKTLTANFGIYFYGTEKLRK
jgi:hypothetical protein